jgi:hypothetical protein
MVKVLTNVKSLTSTAHSIMHFDIVCDLLQSRNTVSLNCCYFFMYHLLAAVVRVCNGGAISCLLLPDNKPPIIPASHKSCLACMLLLSLSACGNDFAIHSTPCNACVCIATVAGSVFECALLHHVAKAVHM